MVSDWPSELPVVASWYGIRTHSASIGLITNIQPLYGTLPGIQMARRWLVAVMMVLCIFGMPTAVRYCSA
jgi:hypothetical protein